MDIVSARHALEAFTPSHQVAVFFALGVWYCTIYRADAAQRPLPALAEGQGDTAAEAISVAVRRARGEV